MPVLAPSAAGEAVRTRESRRVLDPIARTSEVLFGLIMALTFTGTISAATSGREEIRTLLVGVIGCNLAWGLVDAAMFLVSSLAERGHLLLTVRAVRSAGSPDAAHRAIADAVPPILGSILDKGDLEKVRLGVLRMDDPGAPRLTRRDWIGALAVFLLVFLSTFPIVIPFLVVSDVRFALRMSNLIALVMLFLSGFQLARHGGHPPVRTGVAVMLLGVVLVAITIALGG